MKDDEIKESILKIAKEEFLELGFQEASMRNIAKKAGLTTGSLYNRFQDKDEIFDSLVAEPASKLIEIYTGGQKKFFEQDAQSQKNDMYDYTMSSQDFVIDHIYDNFDAFKLIFCKSKGSSYECYLERLIDIETDSTVCFISNLKEQNIPITEVREDLSHMLASAFFNGVIEIVYHDMPRDDAKDYLNKLCEFYYAGWAKLLGLKSF